MDDALGLGCVPGSCGSCDFEPWLATWQQLATLLATTGNRLATDWQPGNLATTGNHIKQQAQMQLAGPIWECQILDGQAGTPPDRAARPCSVAVLLTH
eukprot:1675392-Prymnesium_polylepis.1